MQPPLQPRRLAWIETFRSRSRLDLLSSWHRCGDSHRHSVLEEPWGALHRPDWAKRGLLIWPRGGVWLRIEQTITWPEQWEHSQDCRERLVLSWWADQVRLWVDGVLVHQGDLFDTRCRWMLPVDWMHGAGLRVVLELRSPCHDDGALIESELVREPRVPAQDPQGCLLPQALDLAGIDAESMPESWLVSNPLSEKAASQVHHHLAGLTPVTGEVHWVGHAHLDLAWLWPVADTWQAAERTFRSALNLMELFPELHFAHSTPALYEWMERHRPALFARIQQASRLGRWEPINGPWVETDCVLVSTASLWRQFALGQNTSRRQFPEWSHDLAWLPDSFGFASGLPAVANATGVRWFCTHKLAWNATNAFPHRLFRWRSRGGAELLALMLPGIGTDADPLAMQREQTCFKAATGVDQALWLPGVGDHGGGPTREMLEEMQLWDNQPQTVPRRAGTVRAYLKQLEPLKPSLPVWRDELYLELHRGCATSRPDQKRHNRTLERLLREVDLLAALGADAAQARDWPVLLFQQFHDILPGTSIPEVFDQAESQWRVARRRAARARTAGVHQLIRRAATADSEAEISCQRWSWCGLQPLQRWSPLVRLPSGQWRCEGTNLPSQVAPGGDLWVQLPVAKGVVALPLECRADAERVSDIDPVVRDPVQVQVIAEQSWRLANGRLSVELDRSGLIRLQDFRGVDQLSAPLQLRRYGDRGEFWDAWDLAVDYPQHQLPITGDWVLELAERGPLLARVILRRSIGDSSMRMDVLLRADSPYLELQLTVDWRQTHELLRLSCPLARPALRWAADTSGGVISRPAIARTAWEKARWEVPVISWLASEWNAPGGGLGVLLDGPQGVDADSHQLGISLLRGPTWPDPSADHRQHRHRIALMPLSNDWYRDGLAQEAIHFREPGWLGPADCTARWQGFPALPAALIPICMQPDMSDDADRGTVVLQVLNPGGARINWTPGAEGWWIEGDGASVSIPPGAIREIRLIPRSSQWSS